MIQPGAKGIAAIEVHRGAAGVRRSDAAPDDPDGDIVGLSEYRNGDQGEENDRDDMRSHSGSLRVAFYVDISLQRQEASMHRSLGLAFVLCAVSLSAQDLPIGQMTQLAGMQKPGMVIREANGIPHVFALTLHDSLFLNGWLHAQDRLFQMDTNRRIASGTLGEVLGSGALSNDVQLRTFGLRRAAEASLAVYGADARAALDAYTAGVNAFLQAHPGQLSPEYALLGITSIPPWTPVDSVAIGKLIALGLSFDLDLDATVALISDQTAGKIVGFDGAKLFTDTWRVAPFTKAATIPDATGAGAAEPIRTNSEISIDTSWIKPETFGLLRAYREEIRDNETLMAAIDPERHAGSNEWAIAPKNSATGNPLIATDPHLSLSEPPNFYPLP